MSKRPRPKQERKRKRERGRESERERGETAEVKEGKKLGSGEKIGEIFLWGRGKIRQNGL